MFLYFLKMIIYFKIVRGFQKKVHFCQKIVQNWHIVHEFVINARVFWKQFWKKKCSHVHKQFWIQKKSLLFYNLFAKVKKVHIFPKLFQNFIKNTDSKMFADSIKFSYVQKYIMNFNKCSWISEKLFTNLKNVPEFETYSWFPKYWTFSKECSQIGFFFKSMPNNRSNKKIKWKSKNENVNEKNRMKNIKMENELYWVGPNVHNVEAECAVVDSWWPAHGLYLSLSAIR